MNVRQPCVRAVRHFSWDAQEADRMFQLFTVRCKPEHRGMEYGIMNGGNKLSVQHQNRGLKEACRE